MNSVLPEGCRLISVPGAIDERGALAYAEVGQSIPFDIRRVFWIYDIPQTAMRGGHAHWTCSEVVVAVSGAFTMCVDDGAVRSELRMESPESGILIPAGVWCELKDFEPGTVLVVMASHPYDDKGYVHNYTEYIKQKTR